MNRILGSQIEWFIIITILELDLFLRNNKKSLTRFRIDWKFIFCVVNYETSESCQIMFLYVIFGFSPL